MTKTLEKSTEMMPGSAENPMAELSEQKRELNKRIRNLFYSVAGSVLGMKDEERFWELMTVLQKECTSPFVSERYGDAGRFKHGTSTFAWKFAFGDYSDDFYELLSFIKTYNEKTGKISKALYDVVEGYGDDGYGDFCDSFLMHGREAYEKALQGELVKDAKDLDLGENYVRTNLETAAMEYFEGYAFHKKEDEKYNA